MGFQRVAVEFQHIGENIDGIIRLIIEQVVEANKIILFLTAPETGKLVETATVTSHP